MTFVILIPTLIAVVVVVAIIYRAVMVRRRSPMERAESPDQIRH
jgi:hypothetical protein